MTSDPTMPHWVSTPQQLSALAEYLQTQKHFAWDTEFIRESTFFPQLELIQIGDEHGEVWLVDPRAFKQDSPELTAFLECFTNPKILKFLHAAHGDQECLWTQYRVLAKNTLDTGIAASLCGLGDQIGLAALIKKLLGITLQKGHARTNWSVRPLPRPLQNYAAEDVRTLVSAGLKLLQKLDRKKRRDWALELSAQFEDPKLYEPDPRTIAEKINSSGDLDPVTYSVLLELVYWREGRVRDINRPRKWIADDGILVSLARVRPRDLEHLRAFRGISEGELERNRERILAAIHAGIQKAESGENRFEGPQRGNKDRATDREAQVLAVLQVYLGWIAEKNEIAPRLLATAHQLLEIIRTPVAHPSEWVEGGLISKACGTLVGDDLHAFLSGKKGLAVKDSRSIVEVEI